MNTTENQKGKITAETIKRYKNFKNSENPRVRYRRMIIGATDAVAGGALFGYCAAMSLSPNTIYDHKYADFLYWVFGLLGFFLMLLGVVFIWIIAARKFPQKWEPEFNILERWKKFSGESVDVFPTSDAELKNYRTWAENRLSYEAKFVNNTFAAQKEVQEKLNTYKAPPDQPLATTKKETTDLTERLSNANRNASKQHQNFLGLWDLVTNGKNGDGLGILKGPEWQDPQKFLESPAADPITCAP